MNDTTKPKTPAEQLREAIAQQEKLIEQIDALRKETREADLATVKQLCSLHGFTATDLRGSLKTKGATKTATKSTGRGRKKA